MKTRADQLLTDRNLAPSRTRAQSLILAGVVFVGTKRVDKPGQLLPSSVEIIVKGKDHPYVGRGGVKLKAALSHFNINPSEKICLDVGASTGGFTDCLLKEGSKKVYAVDVGSGQLDWSLRNDPRVVVLDEINFRYFDISLLKDRIDIAVVDVSFISLKKIIPKLKEIEPEQIIALIKPQFETGPKFLKKGIVKDESVRLDCVEKIRKFFEEEGFKVNGTLPSPIQGAQGNQEYLIAAEIN